MIQLIQQTIYEAHAFRAVYTICDLCPFLSRKEKGQSNLDCGSQNYPRNLDCRFQRLSKKPRLNLLNGGPKSESKSESNNYGFES